MASKSPGVGTMPRGATQVLIVRHPLGFDPTDYGCEAWLWLLPDGSYEIPDGAEPDLIFTSDLFADAGEVAGGWLLGPTAEESLSRTPGTYAAQTRITPPASAAVPSATFYLVAP